MPYPYKPGLDNYSSYEKSLPDLARSSDKDQAQMERFCAGLDHVRAYDLDKLKAPLNTQRRSSYKSVDALYQGNDGRLYFIEFKCQPSKNIDKDSVWGKAVDSLAIGGFMFANDQTIVSAMRQSVFILVYDSPDVRLLMAWQNQQARRPPQKTCTARIFYGA